ncbi:hypothetical protein [Buttiauxella gaviniae]|uniref:hypothetical protein n=1 Tax=Buttiauxella gaviniae TaxID=82990 RepID=UPI003C78A53D
MAGNRDNFSADVKRRVAHRAGHQCSFEKCHQRTSGPAKNSNEKGINIGIAAHISAAAPLGPRYDADMTSEQRKSISNAIWLCPTHATIIDKEHNAFTIAQLKEMKLLAEAKATRNMEFNLPILNLTPDTQEGFLSFLKDRAILTAYTQILNEETVKKIRNELFKGFVSNDVIEPLEKIRDMEHTPEFKFNNTEIEDIRQSLNESVSMFFTFFTPQCAGIEGGYEYIDIRKHPHNNTKKREHWENYITDTRYSAEVICSIAVKLREIYNYYIANYAQV